MASWAELEAEIQRWQDEGLALTMWWRDDDAAFINDPLERLLELSKRYTIPLGLACIPYRLTDQAIEGIMPYETVYILQHGYNHMNYALKGQKKCELGDDHPLQDIIECLEVGRNRLALMPRFYPVIVPPWNRISDNVMGYLKVNGFEGISTFKARESQELSGLFVVNTHVDIIDWKQETKGFLGEKRSLGMMLDHLQKRRLGHVDAQEPTGVLSHHLVHDELCWAFLGRLFECKGIEWVNPFEKIGIKAT